MSDSSGEIDDPASSTGSGDGDESTGEVVRPEGTPVWVAVGARRYRATSFDGQSWGEQTHDVGGGDADLFRGVAWGNGYFMAVGGLIARSEDGLSWEEDLVDFSGWFGGVAYGNDRWVVTGGNGRHMVSSDDGDTWTSSGGSLSFPGRVMAFGDGVFVTTGDGGGIATSVDGESWSDHSQPVPTGLTAVAYGAGTWVALGRQYISGGVQTHCFESSDASTWHPCTVSAEVYEGAFASGGELFIAHDAGYAFTSDGVSWEDTSSSVPPSAFEADDIWVGVDGNLRFFGEGLASMASVPGSEHARSFTLGFVDGLR